MRNTCSSSETFDRLHLTDCICQEVNCCAIVWIPVLIMICLEHAISTQMLVRLCTSFVHRLWVVLWTKAHFYQFFFFFTLLFLLQNSQLHASQLNHQQLMQSHRRVQKGGKEQKRWLFGHQKAFSQCIPTGCFADKCYSNQNGICLFHWAVS